MASLSSPREAVTKPRRGVGRVRLGPLLERGQIGHRLLTLLQPGVSEGAILVSPGKLGCLLRQSDRLSTAFWSFPNRKIPRPINPAARSSGFAPSASAAWRLGPLFSGTERLGSRTHVDIERRLIDLFPGVAIIDRFGLIKAGVRCKREGLLLPQTPLYLV